LVTSVPGKADADHKGGPCCPSGRFAGWLLPQSNHVHLVAIPHRSDDLSLALRHTHGRYASYWNARHQSSGHVWQGRYYSCPLDGPHLWQALRYTELNPVRAGLVPEARLWKWSSAADHCGTVTGDGWLTEEPWRSHWTADGWQAFLALGEQETEIAEICRNTHTGRPLGTEEFIHSLEQSSRRRLALGSIEGGSTEKPGCRTKARNTRLVRDDVFIVTVNVLPVPRFPPACLSSGVQSNQSPGFPRQDRLLSSVVCFTDGVLFVCPCRLVPVGRGRDDHCWPPPAQIRASGITAHGSYLG
jgi:putative transposase